MPNIWTVFQNLSNAPCHITDEEMEELEHSEALLYNRMSAMNNVNEARNNIFRQGKK